MGAEPGPDNGKKKRGRPLGSGKAADAPSGTDPDKLAKDRERKRLAREKAKGARPVGAPPPAIDLEKEKERILGGLAPEEQAQAREWMNALLSPEDMTFIIQAGFFTISNFVLDKLKREQVTTPEAERWAKITFVVYGEYLRSLKAGMVIHGLVTASILLTKKPIPKEVTA